MIVLTSAVSTSDSGATSGLGLLDAFFAGLGLLDAFVSTATGGDKGVSGVVTLSSAMVVYVLLLQRESGGCWLLCC